MSHLDPINACKKRRRGERVFKFKMFGEKGHPVDGGGGAFVENVKALLEFGNIESGLCSWGGGGIVSWSFQLEVHRHPPAHVTLFVVEEPVEVLLCRRCKHCQYVGWGHHMICNKKYHFLLPSKYTTPTKGKSNLLELKAHMMHGVFHSNGFGHLLCLNGLEMGSDLPGYRILEFWDRLCTGLRARKVSLSDDSQKKGMELRLIHGVGYGEPWFGQWGYGFGRGTYGVTLQMYQKAIEALQTMPLCMLAHHLGNSNHEFTSIISRYQTLSSHSLATLGDLFHFMLELKSRLPKERYDSHNGRILVGNTCRWSQKRVEMATRVIVEALKRTEFSWVSRQEVRDAARAYIGDTGLLDFVLKSLGNHIVGDYLVRRSLNPVTKVLEYCLEDISNSFLDEEGPSLGDSKTKARYMISRVQLTKDMFYLYKFILRDQNPTITMGMFATISIASRIILDTKYLTKEYYGDAPLWLEAGIASERTINSTVVLMTSKDINCADGNVKNAMAPYESFRLNINATIDELKLHVEKRFREVYWGLRSFVAQSILNVNAKGSDSIFGLVEDGGRVVFEGRNEEAGGTANEDIFEGNEIKLVVDCACGAQEDDGERMVTCDICEVWQHTRCVRIPNDQEIPTIFLCSRCEHDILLLPNSLP